MATDMALKLDGIEGESKKDGHTNEIDVLAFSFGASQAGIGHMGGGGTAGTANVQDITITKYVDKSSPLLFLNCVKGVHIPNAVLSVRKAGGDTLDYFKITMTQVIVTSVKTGAAGSADRVEEVISLNFETVQQEYTPQKEDGTGLGPVIKGWDVAQGKEI